MSLKRYVPALACIVLLASCSSGSMSAVPSALTADADRGAALDARPLPAATRFASNEVDVGPGFSDVSPHQILRTSKNVVYIAVPSCISYPTCFGNVLAMRAGNVPGNPTSFSEKDAAHHPQTSASLRDAIGSSAIAIDGNDVIWVVYNTRFEGVQATSFDTRTNSWRSSVRLGTASAGDNPDLVTQGREGVAVAVDRSGIPAAVYTFIGSDKEKHVAISQYANGTWSAPVQVDDTALASGQGALHPTIAYAPNDTLLVAWLVGNETAAYNVPDGTIHVRQVVSLTNMPASVEIPDTNFQGHAGYAATTIDQGPSLLVTGGGTAHITYIDTGDYIRFWESDRSDYTRWVGNRQPGRQQTHDPSLGLDGTGGLYIYGHGTPQGGQNAHGNNLYRMHLADGATAWSPFVEIVSDTNVDCSVSTRWSQFFFHFPSEIDYTYWNDRYPNEELASFQ